VLKSIVPTLAADPLSGEARSDMPATVHDNFDLGPHATALVEALNRGHVIVVFDAGSGRALGANAVALKLVGADADAFVGRDLADVIVETRDGSVSQAWSMALDHDVAPIQCHLRVKSGATLPILGDLIHRATPDGAPKLILIARAETIGAENLIELKGRAQAVDRAQAIVEFDLDGTILTANENFLRLMGYSLAEVRGKPHRMFCEDTYAASPAYEEFWSRLRAGFFIENELKRIGRGGREIWIRASYNPLLDADGAITKIIKYAMDVTATKTITTEAVGKVTAIERAQAVIEFDLQGIVLTANKTFLDLTGYALEDVVGQHHRMFCEPDYARGAAYKQFWQKLGRGEFDSGEYKRVGKGGKEIWIQATYNPILDPNGNPVKVVKFALDVTQTKLRAADFEGKVNAMSRSQAIIEFDLKGTILAANEHFLRLMDYSIDEIKGKHHKMFCETSYTMSEAYADFWHKLGRGEYEGGEYKRIGKGGKEVWIQSTYNPIFDLDGKPWKVIKFAYDVTGAKRRNIEFESKVNAIGRAQAVVEFDLTGHVIGANQNFLSLMGYGLADIAGKHHRMFCEPGLAHSERYITFWEKLARGEFDSGEYKRVGKGGREVWIQATYNPILDLDGRPVKIVKFAIDITGTKMRNAEFESRVTAIDRGQAVIEFDTDGNILAANENFLRVVGYSLRELVGQHHSTLCPPDYIVSQEYRDFWLKLGKGEFLCGRFHRIGKFNRDVHIQASYSPILDLSGRVTRVIKYAFDITDQVKLERRISAKSEEMTRVIGDLTNSIAGITRSTASATSLSSETQVNAKQGYDALNNAIEAIELIQRSSNEISDIVKVIGDIASQTNLLAFNAAIEAARAGDHGVGFSVVAGEVRRLAERSSQAAREITKLIGESVSRVSQGTDRSRHAKQAFEQIVGSVGKTGESIRDIAQSAESQQGVSRNVTKLIGELTAAVGR
jgi:methyl-accepting chemotaxis protein